MCRSISTQTHTHMQIMEGERLGFDCLEARLSLGLPKPASDKSLGIEDSVLGILAWRAGISGGDKRAIRSEPRFVTALSPTTTLPSAKNVTPDLDLGKENSPRSMHWHAAPTCNSLSSLCSERQELLACGMVWYDGDGLATTRDRNRQAHGNIR